MSRLRSILGTGPTRGVLVLFLLELGLSVVYWMSEDPARETLRSIFLATPDGVWRSGKVWTLLTSGLLEPRPLTVLFHGLILWSFVPTLENWWGTGRLYRFAIVTTIAATLCGTLAGTLLGNNFPIAGLDPFIYATIVAFGVLYAKQSVNFFGALPLTGRQLMWGFIAFSGLFVVFGKQWSLGAAYVAAMGWAWLLTTAKWNPRLWLLKRRQSKLKGKLKVHTGGLSSGLAKQKKTIGRSNKNKDLPN